MVPSARYGRSATDIAGWPSRDPHEQKARFEGHFTAGAKGWSKPPGTFTITAVEPERMWASEAGVPFGRLRGENRYQSLADGTIRVSKRVEVHGPFGSLSRGTRASRPVRSVKLRRPLAQQGVADHAGADRMMTSKVLLSGAASASRSTSTRRCPGPGGDLLRETLQHIAARARTAS
jgi:hypothetical protein